jgi:hypothetical protein
MKKLVLACALAVPIVVSAQSKPVTPNSMVNAISQGNAATTSTSVPSAPSQNPGTYGQQQSMPAQSVNQNSGYKNQPSTDGNADQ